MYIVAMSGDLSSTIVGGLLGGGFALVVSTIQSWRASTERLKSQREGLQAADEARHREAYLMILTWLALSRDQLRRTIDAGQRWTGEYSDEREQAHLDAVAELNTTSEFRALLSDWRPTFRQALLAHEDWYLTRQREKERGVEEADWDKAPARRLEERLGELALLIERIRQQARADTGAWRSRFVP